MRSELGRKVSLQPKIIESRIPAERQGARRHYGVHPYFTRRPFNVVRDYILNYTVPGDVVIDPFGGSGVTAIEAYLENRTGIHNDINPLANFIAGGIAGLVEVDRAALEQNFRSIETVCRHQVERVHTSNPSTMEQALALCDSLPTLPRNIVLPRSADVGMYWELFTPRQIVCLSLLKNAIDRLIDTKCRGALLLAWSATLAKLNKTFLSAEGRAASRGGSSIFSIYRYKIANSPVELAAWETFRERFDNVLSAKTEIDHMVMHKRQTVGWSGEFQLRSKNVDELAEEFKGKADYVFTDPPYGGHISYLDLSVLWSEWLGIAPCRKSYEQELIVGGEFGHTKAHYVSGLKKSVESCLKMLRPGGYCSLVFQHWDVSFFEAILTGAVESGAELKAAVSQVGDPIWSMHKKKGSESVLGGELILTFQNLSKPQRSFEAASVFDTERELLNILENASNGRIYGEEIFNRLVLTAWNRRAMNQLNMSKEIFNHTLEKAGWTYQEQAHCWEKRVAPELQLF